MCKLSRAVTLTSFVRLHVVMAESSRGDDEMVEGEIESEDDDVATVVKSMKQARQHPR